ncbi:MAG: hypothetical protein ACE5KM_00355 [Planctomycetaceae bacterium]
MPHTVVVPPNHKAVKEYDRALERFAAQDVEHELALRSAFQNLLDETGGRKVGWTLIPELSVPSGNRRRLDGLRPWCFAGAA